MTYFLYGLFFLSCIVLVVTVLLQPGKSDAGALFTSSTSSNAFGSRGTATVLSKTTIITATIFMLSALMLSMPALHGGVSVLSSNPDTQTETPAANTNANVDANAPATTDVNSTVPPASNVPAPTNTTSNAPAKSAVNAPPTNTAKKDEPKKDEKKPETKK